MKAHQPSQNHQVRASYPCEACGRGIAASHVTVKVVVFNGKSERHKIAQFWLCENCERKNRILLTQDSTQRERVARAMTPTPPWWTEERITNVEESSQGYT